MNKFEQPTRQSTIAILFILGKVFRILLRQLWVVLLIVLFNPKKKIFTGFTVGLIGIAAVGSLTSIISYFRTFFYIQNGELVLEHGVLRKSKVAVPLDRIQTVNFKQSLLHQLFDVVSIEIDTAGSIGKEFSLAAIDKKDATALRAYIETIKPSAAPVPVPKEALTAATPNTQDTGELVFQLGIKDLLKIGVSQNHLRTAGIIMVFFLSFMDDLEDALDLKLTEKLEQLIGLTEEAEFYAYLLIGVPFFLMASFLLTLFRTVLQYFSLRFWRTSNGFKMESGLLTKQEVSANLQKIQFIRWDSSPLKRFFNMISVRLPQAASVQVNRKLSAAVIPGCYVHHLDAIRGAYFPEENDFPQTKHGVHWRIIIRMFFIQGILPTVLLMLMTQSWLGHQVWIWLCWLPAGMMLSYRYYLNWQWYVSEAGIRTSWGVMNQHNVLLKWYKVQAVTVSQNYFLRRRNLSNLTLYTAAGAVRVPYIDTQKAKAVRDFVLYKIETDERSWM